MARFGPYTTSGRLGTGAFSVVYRARREGLDHDVALKVLDETGGDEESVQRFAREADIVSRLADPAIPRIHDIGSDGARHYIAMDIVEGRSLDTILREDGPRPLDEVVDVALQLSRVLATAHAMGVVHRDVKPANLLMTRDRSLKLLDFGLSHVVGVETISTPGALLGTVPYMSPEQLLGEGVDARSDVFSANAVLYELLTGHRPFSGDRFEALTHAILFRAPRRLAEFDVRVPESVERLLLTGLAKRPEHRYARAADMQRDWQAVSSDPGMASIPALTIERAVIHPSAREYVVFVDRDAELASAAEVLEHVRTTCGHVVALGGQAGSGKSRLLGEIAHRAAPAGYRVLAGRCQGGRGTRPYQAWADLLEAYFREEGVTSPEGLKKQLEAMGLGLRLTTLDLFFRFSSSPTALVAETEGLPGSPDVSGLWDTLVALLKRVADDRPLLITLDDIHRGDALTVEFLAHLATRLGSTKVAVIAAYRTDETGEGDEASRALLDAIVEMRRRDLLTEIAVPRLETEAVAAMVRSRFGDLPELETLVDAVEHESEGNPLYVVETLKHLEAERVVEREDAGWRLTGALDALPIPQKVADLIEHRLSRVNESDREILDAAAVAGDPFPAKVLADCFEMPQLTVLRRLRSLEQVNGIIVSTEDGFRFAQSKVREFLLETIPNELERAYHRSIGTTLAKLHGDHDEKASQIAEHLSQGDRPLEAVPHLERSGDRDFRLFANERALATYEAARSHLESLAREERATDISRIGSKICAVELRLGRFDEAVLTASLSLRLARRLDAAAAAAEALLVLSEAHINRGDGRKAIEAAREARAAFGDAGGEEGVGRALDREGDIELREGRPENALALHGEALAIRERLGLSSAVARSHYRIGMCLRRLGRIDEAVASLTSARSTLEATGDRVTAGSTSGEIGNVHFARGDLGGAAREYTRCVEVMRSAGEQRRLAIALNNAGNAEMYRGDLSRAVDHYSECLSIRLELGEDAGVALARTNLAQLFRYQARYESALSAARDGREGCRDLPDQRFYGAACRISGWLAFDLDDLSEAHDYFVEVERISRDVGQSTPIANALAARARALVALGSADEAEKLADAAGQAVADIEAPEVLVSILLARSAIAETRGELDTACDVAREAVSISASPLTRAEATVRWLTLAVESGDDGRRRARGEIPDALSRLQAAGVRGFEFRLRTTWALLESSVSIPSALEAMRGALAVADTILPEIPASRRAGWARHWGYDAGLHRLASWAAEIGDTRLQDSVRRRRARVLRDGG